MNLNDVAEVNKLSEPECTAQADCKAFSLLGVFPALSSVSGGIVAGFIIHLKSLHLYDTPTSGLTPNTDSDINIWSNNTDTDTDKDKDSLPYASMSRYKITPRLLIVRWKGGCLYSILQHFAK